MKANRNTQNGELKKKHLRFLMRISLIKTLYFNFYYLPFRQARHLPVFISKKVYFRRLNGSVKLRNHATIGKIRIGFGDVGIFDYRYSRTIWDVSGSVIFNGKAEIGHGSRLAVGIDGILEFGNNLFITAETSIIAFKYVKLGDDCQLSWDILIMDTDLHPIRNEQEKIINEPAFVSIGNKVWIGCRSLILKGVNIPDNSVIGANTHVYKSLDKANCVYVGNPVKPVIENITWEM